MEVGSVSCNGQLNQRKEKDERNIKFFWALSGGIWRDEKGNKKNTNVHIHAG